MFRNGLILFIALLGLADAVSAQNCILPVLTNFSNPNTNGFDIEWVDNNPDSESFEIEFGQRGFSRTGTPNIVDLTSTQYSFSSLESGTAYELYLRSICSVGDTSHWNGPYFYNTAIENNGVCGLALPINDNNCPQGQNFLIEVNGFENLALGQDVILEKVKLIIEHPWPPDLSIRLISPAGVPILLSQYNGSGVDHYGNPLSLDCSESIVFSDNACLSVNEIEPPLIGDVRPEVSLASSHDGNSPNGIWRLFVCDRANNDLGELRGVELIFSNEACTVPNYVVISDVESDNITLKWENNGCENLRFSYKRIVDPISETTSEFKECDIQEYQISGLEPETDYELTVFAQCDEESNSPVSCVYYFTTSCANANSLTDFDDESLCQAVCDLPCALGGIWSNDTDDDAEWIVNLGPTLTSFTGPEGDKNMRGRYIYVENQPANCNALNAVNLISDCLQNDADVQCSLSFYYHMYGQDVGTLSLEYSQDSAQWQSLLNISGDQGNVWHFQSVEVPSFDYGRLRFSASNPMGALRGDIALDHIKLIGSDTVEAAKYYFDADQDGFGTADKFIISCSSVLPSGYVTNNLDCDDSNFNINPDAFEIPCNGMDENCSGNADDASPDDIQLSILLQTDESCAGAMDGRIELTILQATNPVEVNWSTGASGTVLNGLAAGVYYATITDGNGCSEALGPIVLDSREALIYNVIGLENPRCSGINNGQIELAVAGGSGNYSAIWNDGETGLQRSALSSGSYVATISDNQNCSITTDPIELNHGDPITAGIALRRDVSCFGSSNGLLQLAANGGNLPYSIRWNTGDSTFLITNLQAGVYSVTIEDTDGCQSILSDILVSEPDSLLGRVDNIEHITCPGGFDSFVDIAVEGGTKPYTYLWSNGSFSEDIFNVKAGVYNLTVSDFNACTAVLSSITINEPDPVKITLDSINTVNCVGSTKGYIEVSAQGGNPPYVYNWSINESEANSEPFLDSLGPGLYFLTVVDNFGCKSKPQTFEIFNENIPINIALTEVQENLCFGDSLAAVSAVSTGVLLPVDFNWSNGSQEVKDIVADTIYGLKAGKYNLTITDSEGCVGIADSIIISEPEELQYTIEQIVDNICFGDALGVISIDIEGGTTPYSVEWSNGASGTSISNLKNGLYSFNLSDKHGCMLNGQNIMVTSPPDLELNAILTHPTEQSLGSIEVQPFGGMRPYQFVWSPPVGVDSVAQGLAMGDYNLQIIDSNGCALDTMFTLDLINSTDDISETISIHPNPGQDLVFITGMTSQLISAELIDVLGNRFKLDPVKVSEDYRLNISAVPSGFYYINLQMQNNKRIVQALIVIH
ncbi:MAG: hypothetical protein HKN09_09220 [Saprospiraceae bacterium]|nr:hypothetical protein [Saprospiraceae bacterium]